MKQMTVKRWSLILSLILVVLTLTSCAPGSETSKNDEPSAAQEDVTGAPSESEDETTAPESKKEEDEAQDPEEDSDLSFVKEKGKLVVGVTELEPLDYQEDGQWKGFDAELAGKFAEALGVELEIQEINWNTKEVELEARSIDCIWNGLTSTPDRAEQMELSQPYLKNRQCLVTREERASDFETTDDLKGLNLAVESGSAGESVAEAIGDLQIIEKGIQLDALMEVKAKSADACIIDFIMANYLTLKDGSNFSDLRISDVDLGTEEEDYVVAFRKGSPLATKLNRCLDEWTEDGTLEELAKRYSLEGAL